MTTVSKPTVNARGLDGNIFAVASATINALKADGQRDVANTIMAQVTSKQSYHEALAVCMEYVDFSFAPERDLEEKENITLPAGQYVIVDPCYVLKDDVYNALLDTAFETNQVTVYGTDIFGTEKRLIILHTYHGDGQYYDDHGRQFLVDSGTIACIEVAPEFFQAGWEQYTQITATKPFDCQSDEGDLLFGDHACIYTNGEPCTGCGDRLKEGNTCDCGYCFDCCECNNDDDD